MTVPLDHPSGLGPLLAETPWKEVTAGPVVTLLGPAAHAGVGRALPSSASRFAVATKSGEVAVWVAAPELAADAAGGLAPVYLHGGQSVVLPTVRLFVNGSDAPEYLSHAQWLDDAIRRWRFTAAKAETETVAERAANLPPAAALDLLAAAVRYALFGSARPVHRYGLLLPPMPMWARPTGDGAFARRAARALVVTARLDLRDDAASVPRGTSAAAHRVSPGLARDRGLDPFHTPEGPEIRLAARLGVGVGITAGRSLNAPAHRVALGPSTREAAVIAAARADAPAHRVALGPSTARLPFAGYNDPRRLLMAANMQVQAVPVEPGEAPVVTATGDGPDPPGVNLRVGYLAWGGWNHEDAWVLSESGAARLTAVETTTVVLERRALELDEEPLVRVGQHVRRGELLIARRYAPALLTDDLATLAALSTLDETVAVVPEVGDRAPADGEVTGIVAWDPLAPPPGWVAADGLRARYRRVYAVTLRRRLRLEVGDKLANRHGHKGVVGRILPDDEMPQWKGEPLDALIDPVSVLNRSNWGQLKEAVAAGPDPKRDAAGRSPVELPDGRTVRAMAGVQFVMRLPQHAADKFAAAPLRDAAGGPRSRAQRFGEMDGWAAWAHNLVAATGDGAPARRLAHLLGGAGFRLDTAGGVTLGAWKLDGKPPKGFGRVELPAPGTLAGLYDRLDDDAGPRALVFDPPVELPHDEDEPPAVVRWLPLIPAEARPPQRAADGSEEVHPLTAALRAVVRAVRQRDGDAAGVGYALRRLMNAAYAAAVGRTAAGRDSSKRAWLRRGVLGRGVVPSGRAVVSPAAGLGLALDEIGLPPALAHALFGPGLPSDAAELAGRVRGRTVWLKRDPVLHRWGLLPVRVKVVPGATIRLPASLLGPLGADFDGDTVAVFAALPGGREPPDRCRPPAIAWDGAAGRAMFLPNKQYLHGLHLLCGNAVAQDALDRELRGTDGRGPEWPTAGTALKRLQEWVRRAATSPTPDGAWWAAVERHALAALAADPGLGLGLLPIEALRELDVLTSGAVKNLYEEGPAGVRMSQLLDGRGLEPYDESTGAIGAVDDPIAGVMVAAKAAVGRFGGALRRVLYTLPRLTPELVQAAQTLTERITQKALSVKAGEPPVSVSEFEGALRKLLVGEFLPKGDETALSNLLNEPSMRAVWEQLRAELGGPVPLWLQWLRSPHELDRLLPPGGEFAIPLPDARGALLGE